jgi:hypothetical protein
MTIEGGSGVLQNNDGSTPLTAIHPQQTINNINQQNLPTSKKNVYCCKHGNCSIF